LETRERLQSMAAHTNSRQRLIMGRFSLKTTRTGIDSVIVSCGNVASRHGSTLQVVLKSASSWRCTYRVRTHSMYGAHNMKNFVKSDRLSVGCLRSTVSIHRRADSAAPKQRERHFNRTSGVPNYILSESARSDDATRSARRGSVYTLVQSALRVPAPQMIAPAQSKLQPRGLQRGLKQNKRATVLLGAVRGLACNAVHA
jgi:hypothetical protein